MGKEGEKFRLNTASRGSEMVSQRAGHSLPESRSGGVAKQVSQIPRPMGESWGLGSYEAHRDTRQEERHTEW